jgi:hypothetical protein
MLPYKHYAAGEIEQVLQEQENPIEFRHECGAEESTIRRWKSEFPWKLSALAASLEVLVKISRIRLLTPLQRIYDALSLLAHPPPPDQSRLAWAFFWG